MGRHVRTLAMRLLMLSVAIFFTAALYAAETDPGPVTLTTQEDHQNMMRQLGITALRPGPNGKESAPNHANYDESLANPYPNLPDPLVLKSGERVESSEVWRNRRRAEIVEDFEREVYGRVPKSVPAITWSVIETRETMAGEVTVVEKRLRGHADNSACPSIEVNIEMTLATPKDAAGPVPVLMMFGGTGFGGRPPSATRRPAAANDAAGQSPARRFGAFGPSKSETLAKAGWAYAFLSPASIQADNGAGLTRGIIGLANRGQPRKPDDWGALRAWAWGASRGLDYLETDAAVDAKCIGIEGVSRYGKAALVAMAFEPRFAMALVGSSGEGGAKLHRRNFGEAVENLTGPGEYHWMAGNFLKYGTAKASFGSMTAEDLPVDSHELIALCAPRLTFISYGIPEQGDAKWLDQRGSFMAAVAAGPVYRLLGATALGTSDDYLDYLTAKMPAVNEGLLAGRLAWRQHDGGHTDAPNLEHFIRWAAANRP